MSPGVLFVVRDYLIPELAKERSRLLKTGIYPDRLIAVTSAFVLLAYLPRCSL